MSKLPDTIGKYQIKSLLGEGAMGVVYEGFDPDIERRVAIKTLHTHLVTEKHGDEFLERFKREAISAARCTHPNVVTILEYGQDHEMPYIVMEYVEGASLHEIVKRGRAISLKNTMSIMSQLLKALHSAHQLDIVHRDIKTANVMILKDGGGVKLADFGIARIAESPELTMTGAVVGTPKYMAPEQMFGLKVDSRADLFSVAMVFLELLTLLPKNSTIACSSLPEIINLPPNNRIDYSILYPSALIPVLVKGLSSAQDKRYQSAREFAASIKLALAKLKTSGAAGEAATEVVQQSTQNLETSPEELDSMTSMLVEYVGPIAKNIMKAQNTQNTSISDLASAVSREIPQAEEREAFLRRWEISSGTRINAMSIPEAQVSTNGGNGRTFDDKILENIRENYASYIGPLASRLVKYHSSKTNSLEQLVNELANEIPDASDSRNFREHWLRG